MILKTKPTVVFDASNSEHRLYYREFQLTGSWKNCPVTFEVTGNYVSAIAEMQQKLLQFYMEYEFPVMRELTPGEVIAGVHIPADV